MENTKANPSISTDVIKDFLDDFILLSDRNQILVVGMIKGIAAVDNLDSQKKPAHHK